MSERGYWGHRTHEPRSRVNLPPAEKIDPGEFDPESKLWKERAWQWQGEFLRMIADKDFRETWGYYLTPIPMSWKEIATTFEKAVKEYREGMTVDELSYRVGILPDECNCVLPEQHCRTCTVANKVAAQMKEEAKSE